MASPSTAVLCTDLGFEWPDGTTVLDGFHLAVGPGRTGLIGLNGAGKSTLLRLVAGELTPTHAAPSGSAASSATCRRASPSTPG